MPDRSALLNRDEQEALRRRPEAADVDLPASAAVVPAALVGSIKAGLGSGRSGPGAFPRAMTPASFMAMQRLAGNRAMVQALGRSQLSAQLQTITPDLDELPAPGAAPGAPDQAVPLPGQAGAGAAAPGGGAAPGAPGGGAGPGGSGAPDGQSSGNGTVPSVPAGAPTVADGSPGDLSGAIPAGGAAPAGATTPAAPTAGAAVGGAGSPSGGTAGSTADGAGTTGGSSAGGAGMPAAGSTGPNDAPSASAPLAGGPGTPSPALGASPTPALGNDNAGPGADGTVVPTAPKPAPALVGAGTGGTGDANSAKTGINWNEVREKVKSPPGRSALEIARLIPLWGILPGLAADSLTFSEDLERIPNSQAHPWIKGAVAFRNVLNAENNVLGGLLYLDTLIQDSLAGTVVGAPFLTITALSHETVADIKEVIDGVMAGLDLGIETTALYEIAQAPGSPEADQWQRLANTYHTNVLVDGVTILLDGVTALSFGTANTAVVEEARAPLALAGPFVLETVKGIIAGITAALAVWAPDALEEAENELRGHKKTAKGGGAEPEVQRIGGSLPDSVNGRAGKPSKLRERALLYDMAAGFVDLEAPQARATYDGINLLVGAFEAYAANQVDQINAVVGSLSGGKSAFQVIRGAVTAGLDDMNRKLAMAEELGRKATNGKANADSISAACDAVLGRLDSLVMPDVQLPSVDLGDGILADAAAAVANTAADAANLAIRAAVSSVSTALATAKNAARGPIQEVKDHANAIGEWLAILATKCTEMVATLHQHIGSFSKALAKCTDVGGVMDVIIGQVSDLTGMPKLTVKDMREAWDSVGPYIDKYAAMGPQLHARASALRAQADELEQGTDGGPTLALPPGPPPNPGAGAAPGVGAPG